MRQPEPTWLDRAIGWFSPRALYGRMAWRIRNYDAGGWDRRNDGWSAINAPGAQVDRASRDTVRARARDLERNSDIAESIIRAKVRGIVGRGLQLQCKITDASGVDDEAVNTIVEKRWAEHCRARNFDVQRRQGFHRMCRMAQRRLSVDGGVIFVKAFSPGGPAPLAWQMKEVDELDTTYGTSMQLKNGNYIVDGIEVDSVGRHVAYYFRSYTPDGFQATEPVRVAADRVIYLQHFTRPTQVREMSPQSPTLPRVRDTDEYITNVSVQARAAACLVAFIKRLVPGGLFGRGASGTTTDVKSGYYGRTMTPGMILEGQPGDEVQTIQPPSLGTGARDLVAIQQRLAAAGQGISYEAGSRDLSQTNYSSTRQGLLADWEEYAIELQDHIMEFAQEAYTEFLISAALAGNLPFTVSQLLADKERYMAHEFIPPAHPWIDPMKEAKANEIALNSGQDTLARICAEQGLDWREVIAQRGREVAAMREAGLSINGGGSNAASGGSAAASADGN